MRTKREVEAIVVVDMVEATATSDLYGWYATGRGLMQALRRLVTNIGNSYGLQCKKSTGDGYLLTYRDLKSDDIGAVNAVKASFELLKRLKVRNRKLAKPRVINVRIAIHFGQVDVVEGDREGPEVSLTFRLENISQSAVKDARYPEMTPDQFPLKNYILCSKRVKRIIEKCCSNLCTFRLVGVFELKGFSDLYEVYRVEPV